MPIDANNSQVGHMVYFTLKDKSPASLDRMVASCREFLSGHPGMTYFATGVLAGEMQREVNDRGFDVALQTIFENKQAHDTYQVSERHVQFIEQNKEHWELVRVFDAYVQQ